MSDSNGSEWTWRVGVLNGLGECAWQKSGSDIRRITVLMRGPEGHLGLARAIITACTVDAEPVFPAARFVVAESAPRPDLASDLDRLWSGGKIIPATPFRPRVVP